MVVGIDASRNHSGGAVANLLGVIGEGDPVSHGIQKVHVWAYKKLLDVLPDASWLVKHNPPELEKSLLRQIWWQYHWLPKEAAKARCDVLYSTDAATVCRFGPMVVMSQDMLSYEPGMMRHFGYGRKRLRLVAILVLQNMAFRRSNGVIFLTRYAAEAIKRSCGILPQVAYIPHGVGRNFKQSRKIQAWPNSGERPISCIYVSPIWEFKHQWVVVRGIEILRKRGHDIVLTLVGGGAGKPKRLLEKQIQVSDSEGKFVRQLGFVPPEELPVHLANADIFVFASSCENMPISLMEAMAVGLPIACSERGPMPEVLGDGGVYFDPEDATSIARAIERIILDANLRGFIANRAKALSEQYSWSRCADETWSFIASTYWQSRGVTAQ
jgi:glycosyltransferase involved in cell wall biosynthesis